MGIISGLMGHAGMIDKNKLAQDFGFILAPGEIIEVGYKVLRDKFIFTNKRLILVDVQGLTGRKVEIQSIPYPKITKFSVETAGGFFDLDADLKIWLGGATNPIQKKFNQKVNIYDLQKILAHHVLK